MSRIASLSRVSLSVIHKTFSGIPLLSSASTAAFSTASAGTPPQAINNSEPFMYRSAIVRGIPDSFAVKALRSDSSEAIDITLAKQQHKQYIQALSTCVPEIIELPADESLPDCCFVEDTAVVIGNVAVICRPGAEGRRGETATIKTTLQKHGYLTVEMTAPALLDGGDVLFTGSHIFVGIGGRSNRIGASFLQAVFPQFPVSAIPLPAAFHANTTLDTETGTDTRQKHAATAWIGSHGAFFPQRHNRQRRSLASVLRGTMPAKTAALQPKNADTTTSIKYPLHLKSMFTTVAPNIVTCAEGDDVSEFVIDTLAYEARQRQTDLGILQIPQTMGVNVIRITDTIIAQAKPEQAKDVTEFLEGLGSKVIIVDTSELAKADGALTCCSLLLP